MEVSQELKDDKILALPPLTDVGENTSKSIEDISNLKLNAMGPIIINSDGTMSRIPNWSSLSDIEKSKTFRLISARNKKRSEQLSGERSESTVSDQYLAESLAGKI
mmetsp:Transcript_16537/g.16644  ORF Transcript_16537/g.16644 Transcript_16537/m.16644 type:complete len:106 (-) Transcript_16537:195-512(-)